MERLSLRAVVHDFRQIVKRLRIRQLFVSQGEGSEENVHPLENHAVELWIFHIDTGIEDVVIAEEEAD